MANTVNNYKGKTEKRKFRILNDERKNMPMFDIPFLITVLLILAVGLVMLFSTGYAASLAKTGDSYTYIRKQVIYALIGLVVMYVFSRAPSWVQKWVYNIAIVGLYLASIVLLIVVLFVCEDEEKRWIPLFGFQFQPSELAKTAVIMLLALYFSLFKPYIQQPIRPIVAIREGSYKDGIVIPFLVKYVTPGLIFALIAFLVFIEPHLSGAILILGIGYVMMLTGGCGKWMLIAIPIAVFALFFMTENILDGNNLFLNEYQAKRFEVWVDPAKYKQDAGFQPYQSLLTIGSGGLFGLGYGKSRQKYLFLPEPQNDFIFSVVSEELGFFGVVLIMLLFVVLIWRGIYIAMRARNTFEGMVVIGVISKVAIQTLLNFAVVTNSLPTTGIALPFFSSGGTALILQLAEMGLVLHASRFAYLDKGKGEDKE